ncbi:M56 family metallopeptidase [Paenibacillus nasutitermitis]|uniref:Peptidase M56 domain-containing protein n=1 Tax=Paenibacillus nasutitermitis TaxID=1652958 RepID=A0A917DTF3_9BACL|nr:M56 family metallopeptidase [Paenibacillus nasutitermitis]GGD67176.1 hypothetical protein GCM10010911_26190 [Paenibacillus nasutitermitis]
MIAITVFQSLLISSFVGTLIWMVQNLIKPVTNKVFSQNWHYYTRLIPVCFLLGGTVIINRLGEPLRSVIPDTGTGIRWTPGTISELYVMPSKEVAGLSSFVNQGIQYLLRLENIKSYALCAIVIWAVGAIIFIAWNMRMYRSFKRSILKDSRIYNTVQFPVKAIVSPNAASPMVMGLWNPILVLPDTRLGKKELAMIMSHELVHLKRGDLLIKVLLLLANAAHWFNPSVYSMIRQMNALCELSCDEAVVKGMDDESRRLYGETLLSMLEYGVMQRSVVCTSNFINPKRVMKKRLSGLMSIKKTKKSMMILSFVAALTLAGGGGFTAHAAGLAMLSKAHPEKVRTRQSESRIIDVPHSDGTIEYQDRDAKTRTATLMDRQ